MPNNQENKEYIIDVLKNKKKIVFFGGAGVSTESGIPDFRSVDGLYNQNYKYSPEDILSHSFLFNHDAKEFYRFYRDKLNCIDAEPNIVHKKLAEMEKDGRLLGVITQNIDGLHQKAGSKKIFELHGTIYKNYCTKCHKEYDERFIFESKESIPKCECGGMIRPDVVLYGEPVKYMSAANKSIGFANILVIGGTSLSVSPANTLGNYFDGTDIIIINKEKLENVNFIGTSAKITCYEGALSDIFSQV